MAFENGDLVYFHEDWFRPSREIHIVMEFITLHVRILLVRMPPCTP